MSRTTEDGSVSPPAVDAVGIDKAYRAGNMATRALRQLTFNVSRGECVILAGPSGSGKSTLLSIIGCVLSADSGRIRVLGEDVTGFSSKQRARFRRERIGFLFQRFHLFRGLKAWENVQVAFALLGYPAARARQESYRLLEAVGLADKAASRVSRLSMGQCQRVAFARALAGDPDLILADEPTASLDAHSGLAAMRLLKDLTKQQGKTAIVVTHDPRISPLADRVYHLEDGRIVAAGQALGRAAAMPLVHDTTDRLD